MLSWNLGIRGLQAIWGVWAWPFYSTEKREFQLGDWVVQGFMSNLTTQVSRGSTIPPAPFHVFEAFDHIITQRHFSLHKNTWRIALLLFGNNYLSPLQNWSRILNNMCYRSKFEAYFFILLLFICQSLRWALCWHIQDWVLWLNYLNNAVVILHSRTYAP